MSMLLFGKLKGLLGVEAVSVLSLAEHSKQVNKVLIELQARRRLGRVKDSMGCNEPQKIARALQQHWDSFSTHRVQ